MNYFSSCVNLHVLIGFYHALILQATRLSRILDVAQDLKALSMLLNATPFAFVIDLACLASRREYLKLDKWLVDKIREHGERFLQAAVSFVKRRCPQLLNPGMTEEQIKKAQPLPLDTVNKMLSCLQAYAGNVSQELSESIVQMVMAKGRLTGQPQPAGAAMPGAKPAGMPQVSSMPGLPPTAQPPASIEGMGSIGAAVNMGVANMNLQAAQQGAAGPTPSQAPGFPGT